MWLEDRHSTSTIQLRNHTTGDVFIDKLLKENFSEGPCSGNVCIGSRMAPRQVPANYRRPKDQILEQAKEFIDGFFRASIKFASEEHIVRLLQIHQDIENRSGYDLTFDELEYGVRLAWRNAPRCIARVQWSTLKVYDARHVQSFQEMFNCIIKHITYATNQGRLRSVITVFPPRTDGQHDFRIWNSQLISYAGYRNIDGSIKGDPANVDFTELCLQLGWKNNKRTKFDVLPIVLQANGHAPEIFDLPDDVVLQVPLVHPTYPWFEDLELRWYALPAVSNMLFDCGGLQFPAAPFNGWYMGTEIGARDLCDPHRYNISEVVAEKLELDTSTNATLWKDTVLLEVNKAVLYSYNKCGVTTWDHHTASESFMQFYASEMKTRGGCPADWIWLVPPMSSSTSPLFHQEMALYFLKPSFEYQTAAWLDSRVGKGNAITQETESTRKKKLIKAVIAVRFCTTLFHARWLKRPEIVVLFASQSGKAEKFASTVSTKLKSLFQVQLLCMADCDINIHLNYKQAVLIVASTFGDGEPPNNGEEFKKKIQVMRKKNLKIKYFKQPPRFAVLGLGSKAFSHFCEFAKFLDNAFQELGAIRLLSLSCADELNNQEKSFQTWLLDLSNALSEQYMKKSDMVEILESSSDLINNSAARFINSQVSHDKENVTDILTHVHRKEVSLARVSGKSLMGESNPNKGSGTIFIQLNTYNSERLKYQPGDHLAVFPRNHQQTVQRFQQRLKNCPPNTSVIELQVQGPNQNWNNYKRIPPCTFDTLLSRLIDIASSPSQATIQLMAFSAADIKEKERLHYIAKDGYDEWVSSNKKSVVETLEDFPSVQVDAAALISTLPILQPRFYSISSSSAIVPTEIHLYVSLVRYRTQHGHLRRGVCTSYLEEINRGDFVTCYFRSNPQFHLPYYPSTPLICIASGSGIAPFRGFWQQRCSDRGILIHNRFLSKVTSYWGKTKQKAHKIGNPFGSVYLYYGCKKRAFQPFRHELDSMVQNQIINKVFVAFSREPNKPKEHVQDILKKDGVRVSDLILKQGAFIYICGGSAMATQVEKTLIQLISFHGNMNQSQADLFFRKFKVEGRYRTDVFGTIST